MRLLLILAFCALPASAQMTELLRPTVTTSSSISGTFGCHGLNQNAASMPLAYDAAGLSTSSIQTASGTIPSTFFKVAIISGWPATANTYSALTLNINSAALETNNTGNPGAIAQSYSTNGGSTWTNLPPGSFLPDGISWVQQTRTVTLSPGQDLTALRVAVCVQGSAGGDTTGTTDKITVWDIWTNGQYVPGGTGANGGGPSNGNSAAQVIFIKAVEHKRRNYGRI